MLSATVLIVSHNRKEELLDAVGSSLAQDYPALEVIVLDDASTDGSLDAIRRAYPSVRAFGDEKKRSATVLRNRGFELASGDVVFSLDDDSYFSSPHTISEVMELFKTKPLLAVAAIPFIEPYFPSAHPESSAREGQELSSFTGCAAALRRSAFLELGGYRSYFEYYREEGELSIRLLEKGYRIELSNAGLVVHTKSRKRDSNHQLRRAIRNEFYSAVLNVPARFIPWHLARYSANILLYRPSLTTVWPKFSSLLMAMVYALGRLPDRRPVSQETYRTFRRLPSHGRLKWGFNDVPPPCHKRVTPNDQERFPPNIVSL